MKIQHSWKDPSRYLQHIHVEESCLHLAYTREILDRAGLPWSVVADRAGARAFRLRLSAQSREPANSIFFSAPTEASSSNPVPGTREYQCCSYHVLNTGMNCPMDCVYCILQAYLNNPWISFYVNIEAMFAELDHGARMPSLIACSGLAQESSLIPWPSTG